VDRVLVHAQVQDDVRRPLGHLELALGPLNRRLGALDLRVERHEVEVLVGFEGLQVGRSERHGVEGVARGLPPLGGHGRGLEGLLHVVALHPGGAVVFFRGGGGGGVFFFLIRRGRGKSEKEKTRHFFSLEKTERLEEKEKNSYLG
jgi:hypothetical protein